MSNVNTKYTASVCLSCLSRVTHTLILNISIPGEATTMKDEQCASFMEIVLSGHNRAASSREQQVQIEFNGCAKGEIDELQVLGRIPPAAYLGNVLLECVTLPVAFDLCSLLYSNTHRHKPCCLEPNIASSWSCTDKSSLFSKN